MIRITVRDKPRNRCAKLTPLRLAILLGVVNGTPLREIRKAQRLNGTRHYMRSRNDLMTAGFLEWRAVLADTLITERGTLALRDAGLLPLCKPAPVEAGEVFSALAAEEDW